MASDKETAAKKSDEDLGLQICKTYDRRKSARSNWESHWNEVIDLTHPRFADQVYNLDRPENRGQKRDNRVYEGTAIQANELLASALHGMLTSPTNPFFALTTGDRATDEKDEVRRWLSEAGITLHDILNTSNFQTEIHELYLALGSIGTSVLLIEEDEDQVVRFQTRPIFEAVVAENARKVVDDMYRKFSMPFHQIEQKFGPQSAELREIAESRAGMEFEIHHAIDPSLVTAQEKLQGIRYPSLYVMKMPSGTGGSYQTKILERKGYKEFPAVVPRWTKTMGEQYGRSPAMKALSDIKMLQVMMKTTVKGAQKTVDPVTIFPDDGIIRPMNFKAGGHGYYRAGTQDKPFPLTTDARIDFGIEMIKMIANRVREAFYIDQLQLPDGPQMTATESSFRKEDQQRTMGPVLGRLDHELLRPTIERVARIAQERGKLGPVPDALAGKAVAPKFISQIARAQRLSELAALQRTIQTLAPFIELHPEIMDIFDPEVIGRDVGGITGLPDRWYRSGKSFQQVRGARAQAGEEVASREQESQDVDNVSKLSMAAAQSRQSKAAAQ
jgi:hypothetical protein